MATPSGSGTLTGVQKAAILLIALGDQASAGLLKQLSEEQVQAVSGAIADLSSVTAAEAESVLQEFRDATSDGARVGPGGIAYAKRILTSAFGPEGSKKHLDQLPGPHGEMGSTRQLQNVEPQLLARFVKSEHPQTVAIVLSQLNPIAVCRRPRFHGAGGSAGYCFSHRQTGQNLACRRRENLGGDRPKAQISGRDETAAIRRPSGRCGNIQSARHRTEHEILTQIGEQNSELMDSIRQKMFVFDDLMALDANGVKELLARADRRQLTTALKGTNEELRQHLLKGMSQRGAAMLLEDMEALGPVKIREVEAAQQAIIARPPAIRNRGCSESEGRRRR